MKINKHMENKPTLVGETIELIGAALFLISVGIIGTTAWYEKHPEHRIKYDIVEKTVEVSLFKEVEDCKKEGGEFRVVQEKRYGDRGSIYEEAPRVTCVKPEETLFEYKLEY